MYTKVNHSLTDKNKSPPGRFKGCKPHLNDMARFGCKRFVFNKTTYRFVKGDTHAWVGFYLDPCQRMHGFNVHRPTHNKVYGRYHCLFDGTVVYGDFLGAEYTQCVVSDNDELRNVATSITSFAGSLK